MQYDAIILAGGKNSDELKEMAPCDNEGLIFIGNYPMIYYVYRAVRSSQLIRNIIICGPEGELKKHLPQDDERLFFTTSGDNAMESFQHGVEALKKIEISPMVLALPTDIPFITTEAIDDFLRRGAEMQADFCYPVTTKEANDLKFPGVKRTYVRLKDGILTGGNLFLIRSEIIPDCLEIGTQLVERRKNPVAMGRLFGPGLVIKYLFHCLDIAMIEKRFYKMLGIRGRGIISPYAEIGVDVDKPSDLQLARNYLAGKDY
ncbi:MAG TPA: NTP transferase domain-containing protein [Syntrophomonadaceae bacterium]|nr:NTP transferase domain-containing protein [Syntrophomonadaceae bacterium]